MSKSKQIVDTSEVVQACGLNIFCTLPIFRNPRPAHADLGMLKDRIQRVLWKKRVKGRHLKRVLELGIYNGGSIPWLFETCGADFIVGIDIARNRPRMREILEDSELKGKHALYFETDQSDQKSLHQIVQKHFKGELDLVVDDASHLLHLTRRSFEILFPKLRQGGLYVIEDFGWGHIEIANRAHQGKHPSMAQIVLELTMLMTTNKEWIKEIKIDSNTITVERGQAPLPKPFRIKNAIVNWAGLDMKALRALGVFKPAE